MSIETRQDGQFFYITLNRPSKKNAMDPETYRALASTLRRANKDPNIVFTVFTGKGDFFSSGSDFAPSHLQSQGSSLSSGSVSDPPYFHFIAELIDHSKILIALVNGPAIGIGVTILGLFDLVIASDKSYFTTPFTQLGLTIEGTSSYSFLKNFGRINASRLLLLSEKISATEALQMGIISHVVPHANFHRDCQQHLNRLKTLAPQATLESKQRIINESVKKELWHSHIEERKLLAKQWQSGELHEFIARKFQKSSKI